MRVMLQGSLLRLSSALQFIHHSSGIILFPFSISVDKNAAYPEAFSTSQVEKIVPQDCKLRRVKYLNNVIEQDYRFIKKKARASQCCKRFQTAKRTLEGIESINMMRKGQVERLSGNDAQGQAKFVLSLFQVAA
jgi:transposase, IS6 family